MNCGSSAHPIDFCPGSQPGCRLRHILCLHPKPCGASAGIIPLYKLRGTRDYLVHLLELCFGDELARIHVDDRPSVGFTIGQSDLGVDTRLAVSRPFFFKVVVERHEPPTEAMGADVAEALQHRLRAVIDFAKPAHTIYELEMRMRSRATHRRDHS